ncbi:MAG: HAD family hydrolase [Parcubacteria group bacterium]|jgi:HAD superfamily hydrolase (TIGR01484 family)
MKPINELTKEVLKDIKMIVFDVDGVLVPRGTKIKQENDITTLQTKHIDPKQIEQIKKLKELGFYININSGRGLYMLQEVFRGILPFASITYENGSATWIEGKIVQHINSFEYLSDLFLELRGIEKEKNVKGFEPKEFIMTIHCDDRVEKIEEVVAKYDKLYCLWNGEAYDVGVRDIQNKAVGLTALQNYLNLKKENVLAIGDNLNDKEMIDAAGVSVSADKTRVEGDFFVPLEGEFLPADLMMRQIIKEMS